MNSMKESLDRLQREKKELETKYNTALRKMKETENDKENVDNRSKEDLKVIKNLKLKFENLKVDFDFMKNECEVKEEKVKKLERVNTELTVQVDELNDKVEYFIQRENDLTEMIAEIKSK